METFTLSPDSREALSRWRLILGKFAEETLVLPSQYQAYDEALSFLYDRAYEEETRQMRYPAGTGASRLDVLRWARTIHKLFPQKTVEILQKEALEKYHLKEILADPEILEKITPDIHLLKAILAFGHALPKEILRQAEQIIRQAVSEITRVLETKTTPHFYGLHAGASSTQYRVFRNFDYKKTIAKNLKHYSTQLQTILPEKLYFHQTVRQYNPWDVIILVDQSGSMSDSIIYAAIMASIFARLPAIQIRLVLFDTSVVDMSDHAEDAVRVLLRVQLGGGTNIYKALCYGESLIRKPTKTICILIFDLYEAGSLQPMYQKCHDILAGGTRLLALTALDHQGNPNYHKPAAKTLATMGADVAAITPEELAKWIAAIIS